MGYRFCEVPNHTTNHIPRLLEAGFSTIARDTNRFHHRPPNRLRNLGHYGVSAGSNSVHPMGNPITTSAKDGCRYWGSLSQFLNPSDIFAPRKLGDPTNRLREHPRNSFFPTVGNNEHPVSSVRGTDGGRRNAIPFRVIPDRGQVSENSSHPPCKQRCHVLQDPDARSSHAKATHNLPVESRTASG
jgi:hypothetical protein